MSIGHMLSDDDREVQMMFQYYMMFTFSKQNIFWLPAKCKHVDEILCLALLSKWSCFMLTMED